MNSGASTPPRQLPGRVAIPARPSRPLFRSPSMVPNMHGNRKEVCQGLFPPTKEVCLKAIGIAMAKVRARGVSREQLADALGCSVDVISAATNEENLASFDTIARLCYYFPEECAELRAMLTGTPVEIPTVKDRLERIERELDAIRRVAA